MNPTIVVKDGDKQLVAGDDYTVSGVENISAVGEHVVTITGAGNYNESTTVKFTVSPVVTVTLASDESLVCEGSKGAACNEAHDNIVHVYGVATSELPDASKSGWEFQGWFDGVTGDKVTSIAADRSAELNLVPKFTKDITVVYGEGADDKLQVEIEQDDSEAEIIAKVEAALDAEGIVPTKDDTADSTYEFKGWEQVTDSTGKPVVDENGNGIYEPVFEPIVKNVDIVVAYGTDLAKDTIHVTVAEDATDAQIQESISDAFLNHVPSIPMPTKDSDGKYTYTFDKFVKNEDTGVYEPHFVNNPLIFMVNFNLPEDGKLDTEFNGYVYGEMTMLPTAHIEGDADWLFKGWYTEPDGFGTKVRYIGENEVGDKTVYPLFQKDIDYEANGIKGFAAAHFSVSVNGHALEIVGAKNGVKISVYDMRGRLVTTSLAMSATQRVEIAKTGSYVVRIGSESVRVNVR